MNYRKATPLDWPAIAEFLSDQAYFAPVDLTTIGGHWLIAIDASNKVRGTLWFFCEDPHAFIDLWSANAPMVAARLGALFERYMTEHGLRYAHGLVFQGNDNALRLATGLGMIAAGTYSRVFKEVSNGNFDS